MRTWIPYLPYFPLTPPSPPPATYANYKKNLYLSINAAIEYYNENHQNDQFELVDPLYLREFVASATYNVYHHLSFIARSKKSPSKLKLFFAEFCYPLCVNTSTIVEPGNPLFEIGCIACHRDGAIYHPIRKYEGTGRGFRDYHRLGSFEKSAKRLLREAYTIKSNVQEHNTEDANELKKTIDGYALMALKQYNHENRAFFKPLEAVSSVRFDCDVFRYEANLWVHLIFEAKDDDSTCTDSSPVLFFAELGFVIGLVTTCVTIQTTDSGSSLSGYESSCAVCRDHCPMFHPEGEYVAGRKGGAFADSLYKGRVWAVKSELQQEDADASHAARLDYYKDLDS